LTKATVEQTKKWHISPLCRRRQNFATVASREATISVASDRPDPQWV
jgi:hypothetical protein